MRRFESFATTADVGLRVRGRDWADFYANAVAGFSSLSFGPLSPRAGDERTPFAVEGDGPENVLVKLLAYALELSREKRRAPTGLAVTAAGPRRLNGQLRHRPWPNPPALEIKGVTYHNLRVERRDGLLRAALVFDV